MSHIVEAANGHPVCPRCGGKRSKPEGRNLRFCQECRRTFTATTGHRKHARPHKWAEGEEDILRRGWDNTKVTGCRLAATIGVTYGAARLRASKMGLFKRTDYRKRAWTPGEDGQLEEMVHRLALTTIARKLHRSTIAVCVRAKRLGLIRRVRDGWYTQREVCEILGMGHKWVQRRIDSGDLKATYHNGRKPKRTGMAMWHIEDDDLRDYICSHAHELNGRNVDLVTIIGLFREGG